MSTIDPQGPYTPPPPPPPPGGGGYSAPPPAGGGGYAAPNPAEQLRIFFLVSLIVNAITSVVWLLSVIGFGAATCGLGCLLIFIPAVPVLALVLDAMALSKLGLPPNPAAHSFLKMAAIVDIVAGVISVGIIPVVMGILALLHLQKPEVMRHYGITGF